jgi:CRISPR/Cas system-associated exonuclease Cas4 (RecB family)
MSRISIKQIHGFVNQQVENMSIDKQFLQDLVMSIEKCDESRPASRTYKPSSLHCMRNMYYQIIGITPDPSSISAANIGAGESGTDRHERIQKAVISLSGDNEQYEYIDVADYINKFNIPNLKVISKTATETKCFHTVLNLSFMCDGIVRVRDNYYILEIKTEKSMKFSKREDIEPEHKTQGICYSIAFNIPQIIYLYENRDTLEKKTFLFTVHEALKQEVINKISECDNYVSKLQVPYKTENKKNCFYCKYKSTCEKDR